MADETTTLLIDVKVSADEAIKRQQDLKIAIEAQRSAISELTKEKKGAELAEAKLSEEYIVAESNLKNLNSQLGANQRVLNKMQGDVVGVSGAYAVLNQKSAEAAQLAKDMAVAYGSTDARTIEAVKSAKALSDQLKAVDAATGQFAREVGNYENAAKSMKLELRENTIALAKMKAAGEDNTEAYQKLLKITGELADTIADTREEIKKYASDTQGLDKAIGVFKGIASAAQVAEGAQALLGSESEAVQESIQKMVAIQSVLNGVQEIGNAVQKESSFMMGVMTVKSKVLAGWKITLTTLEKVFGVTAATSMALATAGITVLISGIILLIANFNSIIASLKSFFGIADKFKDTKNDIDANTKALDGFTDATNRSIDRMKAMGKSEQEILNEKKKRFNEELRLNADTYNKIKKLGDDATDEQKEQLKKSYDFVKNAGNERYKLETEQIALTRSLNQKATEDAKKLEEEKNKKIEDGNKKREENNKKRLENEKKAEDERIKQLKENADKAIEVLNYEIEMAKLKEQQRLAGKKLNDKQIYEENIKSINKQYTDEVIALNIKFQQEQITNEEFEKQKKLIRQKRQTDLSLENAASEEAEAKRKEDLKKVQDQKSLEAEQMRLDNEYALAQGDVDRQLQLTTEKLDLQKTAEIEAAEGNAALIAQINEKYRIADVDAHLAAQQAKQEAFMKYADQGMNIASGLNDFVNALGNAELARFEKQNKGKAGFEEEYAKKKEKLERQAAIRNKALSVMSAVMSTAQSIMAALAIPLGAGVPLAITNAAAGALQIATILATPIPGGGGGDSGGASSNIQAPSASISAAANVTGGLVSRSSGQTEQAAATQAMDKALKDNNTTKTVLVTNDLTTALNERVQLQNDNGL